MRALAPFAIAMVTALMFPACAGGDPSAEPSVAPEAEPEGQEPEATAEPEPAAEPSVEPAVGPPTPEPIPVPDPVFSDEETPLPDGVTLHAWDSFEYLGPVDDDGRLPWVWGFQGGTMIRPVLRFTTDAGVDVDRELYVYFAHHALDGAPYHVDEDFFTRGYRLPGMLETDDANVFEVGPLLHQLSWDELLDTQMMVEITVEQDDVVVHHFYRRLTTYEDPANAGPPG